MNQDAPLAYFITWTVYGTFLPGDTRGWTKFGQGEQTPRPLLADWSREQLKHPIELLSIQNRSTVEASIKEFCRKRDWRVWIANARSNHVHVVVTAADCDAEEVRDQMKARCTRQLRKQELRFCDRQVWTRGGSCKKAMTEHDLDACILYAGEVQDRKGRDYM